MAGENKWEQMRAATQAGEVSPWVTLWPPSRRVHSPQGMQGTKAKARLCFGPFAENIETARDGQKTLLESEDLDRTRLGQSELRQHHLGDQRLQALNFDAVSCYICYSFSRE